MSESNKPKARKNDIVVQKLKDETLVYDLNENKAFCLNETSALVWALCDGTRTAPDISGEISKKMKTPISEEFVWLALSQLKKDTLLENPETFANKPAGLSRRQVIRKVGFASVVALPVISSIVAPEAFMAQSACVPGVGMGGTASTCAVNNDCSDCNCLRRNPVDGTRHCCVAGATGTPGNGAAVNPGGFVDCVPNDAGGAATCAGVSNLCCNGSIAVTGLQGVCPAASQQECRCNP